MFVMSGTHRCASSISSSCDGTTKVCSANNSSEPFKISDMAHNDSTVFQAAHKSLYTLSSSAWFLNIHGHADSSCEDVYISNGRADDSKPVLQALKDSLLAHSVNVAIAGDGSSCGLTGTTNTQGRYVNGSTNSCDTQPVSNSGKFFHIEQFTSIRASQDKYRTLIEEISEMIPRTSNSVTFPAFPSLAINEIHFFPIEASGDANGNGSVQTVSDEFVEIVNSSTSTFDLSNWKLSDNTQVRHVFPSGTKLVSGQAVVVFGGSINAELGGAIVQASSTSALSLNNNKETVIINAPTGAPVFSVSYDSSGTKFSGGSLVRNPDVTGNFQYHKLADGVDQSWFSPGVKINGSAFVPYATITNVAGWRMLSAPTQDYPLENISSFTAIQGIGDAHQANLYTGYNGSSWTKPSSLTTKLSAGNGFIASTQGFFVKAGASSLPITLRAAGTVKTTDVQLSLHSNGDKFNLIGNPFMQPINFGSIVVNGGALTSSVGHIWDPKTGVYTTTTAWGDSVGAWQGMMLENNTATSITIPYSSIISSGKFANGNTLKQALSSQKVYELRFVLDNESTEQDVLYFVLDNSENELLDQLNAKKLYPLRNTSKIFNFDKSGEALIQIAMHLNSEMEPMYIQESGVGNGELQVQFKQIQGDSYPIQLRLVDNELYEESVLSVGDTLFTTAISKVSKAQSANESIVVINDSNPRWSASIQQVGTSIEHEKSQFKFTLSQNFPNPFNPSTTINYSLEETGNIKLEIYNVLGELVQVLKNEVQKAGSHSVNFNASAFSSGVYFYKLTSGKGHMSKKMVLIK